MKYFPESVVGARQPPDAHGTSPLYQMRCAFKYAGSALELVHLARRGVEHQHVSRCVAGIPGLVNDLASTGRGMGADPAHRGKQQRLGAGPPGLDSLLVRSEEHTSELQSRSDLVCR